MGSTTDQAIALAGIFQAANIANDLAKTSHCDLHDYQAIINSLFVFDPESSLDVYAGNLMNITSGLSILSELSAKPFSQENTVVTRYALDIITLQKHLSKKKDLLNIIHSRLNHIHYKQSHFNHEEHDASTDIANVYQDTLSTLRFRINIIGNIQHLQNTTVSNKIRSVLFAGVRASMLWRQVGGSKQQILFTRKKMEQQCKLLLEQHKTIN